MKSHSVLALIIASVLFGCRADKSDVTGHHTDGDWGYTGESSPDHWAEISPEYVKCLEGHLQSPIDIESYSLETFGGVIQFDYKPSHFDVHNNGHTIQATLLDSNVLTVDGHAYRMLQLHFHEPSEHHFDGIIYPMEVHLVHMDTRGAIAVVGLFVKEGPENQILNRIWQDLPAGANEHHEVSDVVPLKRVLPDTRKVYNYIGSLTTPPCTEGVQWYIVAEPISMSKAQIKRFKAIYHGNNRPVQMRTHDSIEI